MAQENIHYKQPDNSFVIRAVATHSYDAADRRVSTTDVLGNTTTFTYDATGNRLTQTDANGHATRFEYDAVGRQTAVIDANGNRTETQYDLAGNVVKLTDANGNATTVTYDALGRQTSRFTPLGFETQLQYDANGNVTHGTDANAVAGLQPKNTQNASEYRQYDELNRLTLSRDALNGDTQYTYDLLGNITSITDAEGQLTTFTYDDLGRLIETTDPRLESPDKTDKILTYDEAGNALLTEDRSGRQRRHTYDTLNRRILTEYLSDATQDAWNYDAFGDLVQVSNADVSYTYTYTPRHELASKTDSRLNKTLAWSYDLIGNLTTKTDYQGDVTRFQYDSSNRLVSLQNPAFLQVSYNYDRAGRLLNRILSNGAQTDYQYDADNRLTRLKNQSADKTTVEDLSYQHDNLGNIINITNAVNGKTTTYTLNARYQLTNVNSTTNSEDRSYSYDQVGNRKTITQNGTTEYYCYHATNCNAGPSGNRLINIRTGSTSGTIIRQFQYDDSGRILQKQDGTGTPLYTVTYTGKGRASQITAGTATDTFAYDPNDYRIRKDTKLYHLEGENLEATYSSTGQRLNTYLRGVIIDEIVNGFTYHSNDPNDWTNYTFHHDQLNSVTSLTGHAGSIEETTTYDAFGVPINIINPGTGNDLLYTGREYDRDTGLYYYRARYYDPEIGRFISEDPLAFEAGVNFYAYVGNNPINTRDPSGLINFVDLGFGLIDFTLSTTEAATGIGIMIASPATGPALPATFVGGTIIASHGLLGMTNSALDVQNALNDTSGPGIFELAGGSLFGENGATLGQAADIFTGVRPAAIARDGFGTFSDIFDMASGVKSLESFGNNIPDQSSNFNIDSFGGVPGASGGFVLYPNKANTNQINSVYSK